MFTKTTVKKLTILLVAMLACAIFVFSACTTEKPFKQIDLPKGATPENNGGIAVRYGEYLYYVNGNQSSTTSSNTYTNTIRTGEIVRIKFTDLESKVFAVNNQDMTSSEKTTAIRDAIRQYAKIVVPNFYYTGNTTDTDLNGIYIFNDRLYITTPNTELDADGNKLTDQLVLASYNLGGGDRQTHYVFKSNAPQLKLSQIGKDVYATFVLDGKLSSLKIGGEAKEIAKEITGAKFTDKYVYYLDGDGAICQHQIGTTDKKVVVANEKVDGKDSTKTYTIVSANGEQVYYTVSDSEVMNDSLNGKVLYCAPAAENDAVVSYAIPSNTYFCWNGKIIYTGTVDSENAPANKTLYNIWTTSGTSASDEKSQGLIPSTDKSITLTKLIGDTLYYTVDSITYTLNLNETGATPTPYARSLSTSATGWALPDVMNVDGTTYVFSFSGTTVNVLKFDSATRKNGTSVNITLIDPDEK